MPHLARKKINMTYVLMDNHIYGLTKGQVSPSSRKVMKAYTTPYGGVDDPMDPILYMLTYGATYVAQAFAGNVKMVTQLIKDGMEHKGFAFINVLSQCPTFNQIDTAAYFKSVVNEAVSEHDVTDPDAACVVNLALREDRVPTGLLYRRAPTLDERLAALVEHVGGHPDYDLKDHRPFPPLIPKHP
jgi:2-oxoglutarate ferredoxin oxidoreductase subunit beta